MIVQNVIGGYMYLRSLLGPEGTLYAVVDQPDLIPRAWRRGSRWRMPSPRATSST